MIIIHLTGLLLFTNTSASAGPMQVLMPSLGNGIERHVAELGFYQTDRAGCAHYIDPICYVRIDNSTIHLGRPGGTVGHRLPDGNISDASVTNVDRRYLVDTLRGVPNLNARLTLHEGEIDGICALGHFTLHHPGNQDKDVDLANVVRWTYKFAPQDTLVITRHRIRTDLLDSPADSTWTLRRDATKAIQLFVRYIPEREVLGYATPETLNVNQRLEHFSAFYTLLERDAAEKPLPVFKGMVGSQTCPWAGQGVAWMGFRPRRRGLRMDVDGHQQQGSPTTNINTLSCPVGSGNPGG